MEKGVERVRGYLERVAEPAEIVELSQSTRTSQLAAEALGCSVAQIAKSIVFLNDTPVIVVISGDKRVDARKLSALLGREVKVADPEAVKRTTGYAIGGVPPFPHQAGVHVLLDRSLTRFDNVWTAAGTPHAVMKISVTAIKRITGAPLVDVGQ